MRVGVDIDGVLYDFASGLRNYLHEIEEDDHTVGCSYGAPERWEFYEDWGFDLHDFMQHCHNGVDAGWVFWSGPSFPGARGALQSLRNEGHTIVLITDRHFGAPGMSRRATESWLASHNMPYDELHITADKATVKVDFHIDDKIENYEAMRGAGVQSFLLARPWNSEHQTDATTVNSLFEYAGIVSEVAKQVPQSPVKGSLTASQGEVRVTAPTGGQKGRKLARFDLLPPALWQVAELYGKGAEKYDDWNWRLGYDWSLSFAAMQRHAWLFWQGEDYDQETGCAHMASVAFHALALLTFMQEHPELDDRFKS